LYLHLGQNYVIKTEEIIGIFDIENTSVSKNTVNFLNLKEKNKKIINTATDIPKSFVVVRKKGDIFVYLSGLNPSTLIKRLDFIETIKE
jgi:hypothetical protein